MILIKPSYEILAINGADLLLMEQAGRTCYKSESKGDPATFLQGKIKSKHLTIIEHGSMTVKFIVDRGFTHELVRHRMAVYSQESTRWCNYSGGVTFIIPPWIRMDEGEYYRNTDIWFNDPSNELSWLRSLYQAEETYINLLDNGWTPQQARKSYPIVLKRKSL